MLRAIVAQVVDVFRCDRDEGIEAVLVNRGKSAEKITVAWNDIGYPENLSATIRDLWTHKDTTAKGSFTADVPSHGAVMVRLKF